MCAPAYTGHAVTVAMSIFMVVDEGRSLPVAQYGSCITSLVVHTIGIIFRHLAYIDTNTDHTQPLQNFEAFTAEEIFHMFFNGVHPNDIRSHRARHGNRQYSHQPVCMDLEQCALELFLVYASSTSSVCEAYLILCLSSTSYVYTLDNSCV